MIRSAAACKADVLVLKKDVATLEEIAALSSDRDHLSGLGFVLSQKCLGSLDHIRIKGAGQSLVRTDENDQIFFIATSVEQRVRELVRDLGTESAEHLRHLQRERSGGCDTILRTLHFISPTKALPPPPTPTRPWGPGHLPDPIVFEYPVDGQTLDYEGDYFFKVTDIEGAGGYLWRFSQNGVVVWENQRDEMGLTAGGAYAIYRGSEAHSRFVPGPVEVTVRVLMSDNQYHSDPTVITIILQEP